MDWTKGPLSMSDFADESVGDALVFIQHQGTESLLSFARALRKEQLPALPEEWVLVALSAFLDGMAKRQIESIGWMVENQSDIEMVRDRLRTLG
jgi:hypothetical protein